MHGEREVAGLRCGQVLEVLSDYLEGALDDERRGRVEAHLRGCDTCERFGGRFAGALSALRRTLGPPAPLDPDVEARLVSRLRRATDAPPDDF